MPPVSLFFVLMPPRLSFSLSPSASTAHFFIVATSTRRDGNCNRYRKHRLVKFESDV
jgi:hypothetical protein